MADANDSFLLREYAERQSEAAFSDLVRRHVNFVYSVAMRHVGNRLDAQDVAQAVFVILARKAAKLCGRTTLTGWLYETTRLTARQLLRTRARRLAREQEACMQSALDPYSADPLWRQLAPHLEEAMSRLRDADRELLALRFYENKTGEEAAALLGIGAAAAHKRTSRALEKLQKFFAKRGVDSTAAAIAENISAHSVQVAPAALAKTISAVALAKGATAPISTLTLVKGALKIMAWTKVKMATVAGVTILLATGTTIIVKHNYFSEPRFQGANLSEWLEKIAASESGRTRTANQDRAALAQAQEAVRRIGVNAVPTLLTWASTTNTIGQYSVPACQFARLGFATLGPTALPAVGRLTELLGNQSPLIRQSALGDLAAIGNGAASAVPSVLNCLTNDPEPDIRYLAAGLVGDIGTNQPERVIPVLVSLLNPTNSPALRKISMASLAKFQEQAEQVVPILAAMMNSTNELDIRVKSLQCLAAFRAGAKSALPAIVVCLNDESPDIRTAATNALRTIDPEAAAGAGVRMHARPGPGAQ